MLPHPTRTRGQRKAAPRAGQRIQASLDSAGQVYIIVGLHGHSRCYAFLQFKCMHITVSSRAKNSFWTLGCLELSVSFLYEKRHVNDPVLVKADLNISNSNLSQLREKGDISHWKRGCFRRTGMSLGTHGGQDQKG